MSEEKRAYFYNLIVYFGQKAKERETINQNIANIRGRLAQMKSDPSFALRYSVREFETSGDMSRFGQRVYNPHEIDEII